MRIIIIGFGNVGQALAGLLADDPESPSTVVAVVDPARGSLYDPDGLDPARLVDAVRRDGTVAALPAPYRGWDALATIVRAEADAVVELSPTDLATAEPATSHLRTAILRGMHVVTTNKGPIVRHHRELADLAARHGVGLGVEGTVMSGTPLLRMAREALVPAGITAIEGVLNGTTNAILTAMERGSSYADALADARRRGIAEADPTGDVEGYDAAAKAVILANTLLGAELTLDDVRRRGITGLSADEVAAAPTTGRRWKMLVSLRRTDGEVAAEVGPVALPVGHPLAEVDGARNAVRFTTDTLGEVTVAGPGAGRAETAHAVLCDLRALPRRRAEVTR